MQGTIQEALSLLCGAEGGSNITPILQMRELRLRRRGRGFANVSEPESNGEEPTVTVVVS